MVQGSPDYQSFFIKQLKNIQNLKLPKVNNVQKNTIQQEDVDHKAFNSKGNYRLKTEANIPVSDKEVNEIPATVVPMTTKNTVSYSSPLSFTTPTNISSKFSERSGAVLTPSRIA